jgi:hypothetical protein
MAQKSREPDRRYKCFRNLKDVREKDGYGALERISEST